MKRQGTFQFTAIIGQEEKKKALVLNVVNPRLGGVLITGEPVTDFVPLPSSHILVSMRFI